MAEGEFPKTDGDILYASEVNSVTPARKSGDLFKNVSQLLYNTALEGFNSKLNVATGVPNLKNIKYDIMTSDSAATVSGFIYNPDDDLYECRDFNVAKGSSLGSDTAATSTLGLVKTINLSDDYVYSSEVELNFFSSGGSGTWTTSMKFYYTDNTTATSSSYGGLVYDWTNYTYVNPNPHKTVTKVEFYLAASGSNRGQIRNAYVYGMEATVGDPSLIFQTTSLPTITDCIATWNSSIFKGSGDEIINDATELSSGGMGSPGTYVLIKTISDINDYVTYGTSEVKNVGSGTYDFIWRFNYVDSSYSDYTIEDLSSSSYAEVTMYNPIQDKKVSSIQIYAAEVSAVPNVYEKNTLGYTTDEATANTLTASISADGTNYEEVTDATIHRFTNTGTNLYIKFEIDRVDTDAVDKISEYSIWYNTGAV